MRILQPAKTWRELHEGFAWRIPERYNMAGDVLDRHAAARPDDTALIYEHEDGTVETWSFGRMHGLANRAANLFAAHGLGRGERVGILLAQRPETAFCHAACWKLGAVSLPLFTLFGEDALEYRLENAGARLLVTDRENYPKIQAIRERLPALTTVFLVDGPESGALDFWRELERASDSAETAATAAEDPAFLIYTSGTTGPPKGALHAHRTMFGHLTGFDVLLNFYGREAHDRIWSPADWAWIGGFMDVLIPSLFYGKPVLAFRSAGPFDPERAYHMIAKHEITASLLMPTMLKRMRQAPRPPANRLRAVFTGGESVGAEILDWARGQFGFPVNEGYGQTECNIAMAHVPTLMPERTGALGLAAPGHVAAIVDDDGNELPAGSEGHIAFRRPDPVMLLEYWRNPEATAAKYAGDWLLTGDLGRRDEEGYFWFVGRADDVITSSGYRIGPGEIEDCLLKHPAVALSAAVGVPDPERTEIIKAFIVPVDGIEPDAALEQDIRQFVRERLARHEYPRQIAFVPDLPVTATGKVMRRVLRQQEVAAQAGRNSEERHG